MAPRILVVDDDPALRQLASTTLESHGYDVEVAASGEEALEVQRARPADLVLLDNSMPGMTGCEVAQAMRAEEEKVVPILMLSALVSAEDQWSGWSSGVDLYLTKPYDAEELVMHIERLLRVTSS